MAKFKSGDRVCLANDAIPDRGRGACATVLWVAGARAPTTAPGNVQLPPQDKWERVYAVQIEGDNRWIPVRESWLLWPEEFETSEMSEDICAGIAVENKYSIFGQSAFKKFSEYHNRRAGIGV